MGETQGELRRKYPCGHDNHFTCPFPDCTVDGCFKWDGKPKATDGELTAKKRNRDQRHINNVRLEYYHKNRETINARRKAQRELRKTEVS